MNLLRNLTIHLTNNKRLIILITIDKILSFLNQLKKAQFYGKIVISYENGEVVLIKQEKTIKEI